MIDLCPNQLLHTVHTYDKSPLYLYIKLNVKMLFAVVHIMLLTLWVLVSIPVEATIVIYYWHSVLNSCIFSRKRTGFDKESLECLEQLFRQTVGNEKEIRRDDFKKILITKNVSILGVIM